MSTLLSAVLLAQFMLGAAPNGAAGFAQAECRTDDDCRGSEFCEIARCVATDPREPPRHEPTQDPAGPGLQVGRASAGAELVLVILTLGAPLLGLPIFVYMGFAPIALLLVLPVSLIGGLAAVVAAALVAPTSPGIQLPLILGAASAGGFVAGTAVGLAVGGMLGFGVGLLWQLALPNQFGSGTLWSTTGGPLLVGAFFAGGGGLLMGPIGAGAAVEVALPVLAAHQYDE